MRFLAIALLLVAVGARAAEVKDWTVMVYAAGDEEEIKVPTAAMLKRFERIPSLKADGNVRVVALHDDVGNDPGYRYLLRHVAQPSAKDGPDTAPLSEATISEQLGESFHYGELDSGSALTLKNFVRWAMRAYPARHYILILGGHSWGQQGIMQDFFYDGKAHEHSTMMKNYEVRRAMEEIYREIPGSKIDLLLFDGCVAGQLDVMLEFKDVFDYFMGPSLETPFNAMPYATMFEGLVAAVDREPGATPERSREILENSFLKPTVKQYIESHVRGGSLVKSEGQQDVVEFFAARMRALGPVAAALKEVVQALPAAAFTDWKEKKISQIELVPDSDSNADLLALAKGLRRYVGSRGFPEAAGAIDRLRDSLGYPKTDPTEERTKIADNRADGVWLTAQIDEMAPTHQGSACPALKAFGMLNARVAAALLPRFTDDKGTAETAWDIKCESPNGGTEKKEAGTFDRGIPVTEFYGHKISWASGETATVREYAAADGVTIAKRTLTFWIPKSGGALALSLKLRFPATGELALDYREGGPRGAKLREERWTVPTHFIADGFAPDGLYVAEGHTNGTHLKHGMGIYLGHDFTSGEPYNGGRLPIEKVETSPYAMTLDGYFASLKKQGKYEKQEIRLGDFYRVHRIGFTGWADFIDGKKP